MWGILVPMLFSDILQNVAEFHEAFRIPNASKPHADLTREEAELRHRLMAEENDEYLEAAYLGDMVEVADALGDQLYILAGTMMRHGMQEVIAKVFQEIQSSNMSKLGADGQPMLREDGKVMKGPNYFRPNIAGILESHDLLERRETFEASEDLHLSKLGWSISEKQELDQLAIKETSSQEQGEALLPDVKLAQV